MKATYKIDRADGNGEIIETIDTVNLENDGDQEWTIATLADYLKSTEDKNFTELQIA